MSLELWAYMGTLNSDFLSLVSHKQGYLEGFWKEQFMRKKPSNFLRPRQIIGLKSKNIIMLFSRKVIDLPCKQIYDSLGPLIFYCLYTPFLIQRLTQ